MSTPPTPPVLPYASPGAIRGIPPPHFSRALGLLPAGAPPETRAALAEQLRSYERGSLPADW